MPNFNDTDYELLSSYLDDALTPTEKAALETRLQADSDLLNELDTLRVVQQAVQSLPMLKAPRNFQLTAPMIGQAVPPSKIVALPPRQNSWWVSAAAALVVAIVGIGVFVANNQNAPTGNQVAQVAAAPSATMDIPSQTAVATETDGDVARQATNETATLSADAVIADMVPLNTDTNMMVLPGAEPSSPMQPIDSGFDFTPASPLEGETMLFNAEPMTVTSAPELAMGGAALSTGASEERFATDDAATTGMADLAIQQQSVTATMQPASTQMSLSTMLSAPTMSANTAGMIAPVTATMDVAMSAMVAPEATLGEITAASEQSDMFAATTSQKGILPFWWRSGGSLVAILQTLYLLLIR